MKNLTTTLLVLLSFLFLNTAVMAGAGHEHGHSHSQGPITKGEAENNALKKVRQLAETGKIDTSWSATKATSIEQKTFSKGTEWVITFRNDKISDSLKKNLYLFFSLDGQYIAANYTGN